MTTEFSSLPMVDLTPLSQNPLFTGDLKDLSRQLDNVFTTTGFAYLTNAPLSFSHSEIFDLARDLFDIPQQEKMKQAKKIFCPSNTNTYRGYFPSQPGQSDNLKEGFEIGPASPISEKVTPSKDYKVHLSEPNVWPPETVLPAEKRQQLEKLYTELQALSFRLLSLCATALGKPEDWFSSWLDDSISTLRLLHYPPQPGTATSLTSVNDQAGVSGVKLCCTPHTDSGILTLLHQDPTGGLEVLGASGEWIAAPYIPESIVVNIGDLMAEVSGGRYLATLHRVRATTILGVGDSGLGRISVPFFFEPGEKCLVRSVNSDNEGVCYGEHVRAKMSTWIEFQDVGA
ncbi:Clavaminate synthase-like protein [Cryphonectria parasitica EP155]|uniref:Clavaminate synthase-like protein n=1 Tax=Cryphonectria parasitica (strain ATCC 38755 / EP155) TaxID=660469 RepID=A0A9P4Y711_CRYP1|nr:Clavaminate synthase-like protein [Cryphonectria parasitica EP155]KAF3768129.1 Clavaminate synthase-like protein [Cryphonectria parasitica EP155]